MLERENHEGNIEYKRYLLNLDSFRFDQLSTQMKWRLAEGNGEAIYYLGVNDNGSLYNISDKELEESLINFNKLVNNINAEIINTENVMDNDKKYVIIKIRNKHIDFTNIRVLLLGDTETGKTTLLSNILLDKIYDIETKYDARLLLLNHKHELLTKKTSSFNCHYQSYLNYKFTYIESPGCISYQKTKYKILLSINPNICLLFTDKDNNINKFDLFIVNFLKIPYLIINVFDTSSIYNCKKIINKINFFNQLIKNHKKTYDNIINDDIQLNILNTYPHCDLGIVVSGYLSSGSLKVNTNINWIFRNKIIDCKIKSIYIDCEPIDKCNKSNILTVCVKPTNEIIINKKNKNGLLTNKKIINNINIIFKFHFYFGNNLPTNLLGHSINKLVKLTNIKKCSNDIDYIATVDTHNVIDDIIIINNDYIKGICEIKYLEYL